MFLNQNGDEVSEWQLFQMWGDYETTEDRNQAIALLLEHFGLEVWSTNATKHGIRQLQLRKHIPLQGEE